MFLTLKSKVHKIKQIGGFEGPLGIFPKIHLIWRSHPSHRSIKNMAQTCPQLMEVLPSYDLIYFSQNYSMLRYKRRNLLLSKVTNSNFDISLRDPQHVKNLDKVSRLKIQNEKSMNIRHPNIGGQVGE